MSKNSGLRFGALDNRTAHLCIDMQNLFAEDTPWNTPWMNQETTGNHSAHTETPKICELRARLTDARETMDDLRRRLDRADEQRQQAQTQLAALLADQRPTSPPAPEPPRTAWRRFMAWRRRPA